MRGGRRCSDKTETVLLPSSWLLPAAAVAAYPDTDLRLVLEPVGANSRP